MSALAVDAQASGMGSKPTHTSPTAINLSNTARAYFCGGFGTTEFFNNRAVSTDDNEPLYGGAFAAKHNTRAFFCG
jgi:hypothetical protein